MHGGAPGGSAASAVMQCICWSPIICTILLWLRVGAAHRN